MKRDAANPEARAASLLATTYVSLGGLFACGFVVLAVGRDSWQPLLVIVGGIAAVWVLFWLLRDEKSPRTQQQARLYWWAKGRQSEAAAYYRPRRRKSPRPERFGSNQPPTAERVRELSSGQNTWVPSGRGPPNRRNGRPRDEQIRR